MKGTARFIKVWGSGRLESDILDPGENPASEGSLAVVLERAEHFEKAIASGVIAAQTRAFVPGAADCSEGAVVLGYDGSLSDPGGDVQIGAQFFVQTQDYGTSEYLSLIGATLVKIVDERDFESFLSDADTTLRTGVFTDFLTHPLVRLCDVPALGATVEGDGPRLRLYVDASGIVSTSTAGLPLGEVGDDLATLEVAWNKINAESEGPDAVALGRAVKENVRVAALGERPWMARYHDAIAAVRSLRTRNLADGREVRVSGFGGRLVPTLDDVADPWDVAAPDAPLLLWVDDSAFVYSAAADRTFRLSAAAGAQVESLLVHGGAEAAAGSEDPAQLIRVRDHFAHAGVALGR